MKHCLIIEDLPATRDWLASAVACAFPDIAIEQAVDCREARQSLASRLPDLALVDLGLPDGDGASLIAAIKTANPSCLCIVASTFADDAHLFPALRAGADGYFTKDRKQAELIQALRDIEAGRPPLSPGIARRLLSHFQPDEPGETPLTERETSILQLIGKGYSTGEAGDLLGITRNTAAGYVKEVYRKLGINSRAEAALKAAEFGLLNP